MSFDDDAAGEGAGFRPPPHPDDRLWRHPSEVAGARQAGPAPRPQPRWPWGVVVAVGTVGVVVVTLGGALLLGLRSQVDGDPDPEMAVTTATTPAPATELVQPAWLGIEGYDQLAQMGAPPESTSTSHEEAPPSTDEGGAGAPGEQPPGGDTRGSYERPEAGPTTVTGVPAPSGVVITSVDPEGPAAEALQPGDVVLEVDGEPVFDMDTLLATLGSYEPGDQVQITYVSSDAGDSETTAVVTLGARPEDWTFEEDAEQ